nr:hypothetical protein [Lachnospiraceae bacterium]
KGREQRMKKRVLMGVMCVAVLTVVSGCSLIPGKKDAISEKYYVASKYVTVDDSGVDESRYGYGEKGNRGEIIKYPAQDGSGELSGLMAFEDVKTKGDKLSKKELLDYASFAFRNELLSHRENYVQLAIRVDENNEDIIYLRFEDKYRQKMVLYTPTKEEKKLIDALCFEDEEVEMPSEVMNDGSYTSLDDWAGEDVDESAAKKTEVSDWEDINYCIGNESASYSGVVIHPILKQQLNGLFLPVDVYIYSDASEEDMAKLGTAVARKMVKDEEEGDESFKDENIGAILNIYQFDKLIAKDVLLLYDDKQEKIYLYKQDGDKGVFYTTSELAEDMKAGNFQELRTEE